MHDSFLYEYVSSLVAYAPVAGRAKDSVIEVRALISDGISGRELVLRSDMTLHDLLGWVADVTRAKSHVNQGCDNTSANDCK